MPADILENEESKLRLMEDFINKYEIRVAGHDVGDQTAAIADYLVDEGIGLSQHLSHFWDKYWMAALSGKVPDLAKEGAAVRSLLERGAASLTRAAAVARKGATLSGHQVARLTQFEEQSKAFPLWVEECMARWEMLDRPRQPLNRERLARSQVAYDRGECEDVADIIARLEQGGPFVKE